MQGIKLKIQKNSEPSSAQIVLSIDDLLIEILLRVPITSLLCFKTVSKRWLSIITHPHFSVLYPNRAIGLLLTCPYSLPAKPQYDYVHFDKKNPSKPPFKNLKFINDSSGISVLQSCNGLMLCSNSASRLAKRNYYVCNPTTKHYTTLPKSVIKTENSKIHGISLAFDPLKSPHYKVICVRDSVSSPQHYQIEIYSSQTGPWRLSGDPFIADVNFSKGVYWNGSIYWISTIGNLTCLYFNFDFESLRRMPMPHFPDDQGTPITYFGESCGHLHLTKISFYTIRFDVYEMRRDDSEWFIKYKVDFEHPYDHEFKYYNFAILSLVRGKREEDAFLVLAVVNDDKVMKYNFINKTFEKFCDYDVEDEHVFYCSTIGAFEYIESLCCV